MEAGTHETSRGWAVGRFHTDGEAERGAGRGARYRSLDVEFVAIATLIPFDCAVGMGAPHSCAATGLRSELGAARWFGEKVQEKRDKTMIIRKEEKQTP